VDTYKLRKLRKEKDSEGFDAASLAVPMEIARILPDNVRFRPELTSDGLLYRPIEGSEATVTELPKWLQSGSAKPAKAKPAAA
jgi:hypothetical protein